MGIISPIPTDSNGQPKTAAGMRSLGKDDFLQLLVTKMQYQDPLSPMEDSDFIAQLAQFSTLEQMNNISEGIATSNQWDFLQMQSLNNVMASGLIGREITADFSGIYLEDGADATISYTLERPAESVTFDVLNADGDIVATITKDNLDLGSGKIEWDGKDERGNRLPEGTYTVTASAVDTSGASFTPDLSLVGIVSQITYRDGGAFLTVNGIDVALGEIRSIGVPDSE